VHSSLAGHSCAREGKAAWFPFAHGRTNWIASYIQKIKTIEKERKEGDGRRGCATRP